LINLEKMKFTLALLVLFFYGVSGIDRVSQNISAKNELSTTAKALNLSTKSNETSKYNSISSTTELKENQSNKASTNKLVTQSPKQIEKRCPEKCRCFDDGLVDCTKAGKTSIPSINELPQNTRIIDLSYNMIKRLSTFDTISSLEKLILKHNSIEDVEPEVFKNATNLIELDLSFNSEIILPTTLLQPLHSLKILKLTACKIRKFDEEFFINTPHLKELHVSSNQFEKVDKNFFKHLKELQYLDLTNTLLGSIEIGKEAPLDYLKTLILSYNGLELVPSFQYAPNIENLVLDNNHIIVLNKNSFIHLQNLKTLHLSHNDELEDVEELTFAEQRNLEKLELTNNKNLFLISEHAFYGMYNETWFPLKELNLQKNSLHVISEKMLSNHWTELDSIDLRLNPWHCDCHLAWLHDLKKNRNISEIKCKSPQKLSKKYLIEVERKSMACTRIIDSLLLDKLKSLIHGFVFVLAFLVFLLVFLLIYVIRDRPHNWYRMFGSSSTNTIYYQKANTKELPMLNQHC